MNGILPRFRLSTPVATDLSAPLQLCLDLGIGNQAHGSREESTSERENGCPPDSADVPATSQKVGSFINDQERGIYPLQWEDLASFHTWRREEERAHAIELIASSTVSGGHLWLQKRVYVCARQLSGGPNKYKKKFQRFRKIGTKKTGCRCRIVIKRYHHTPIVLGRYVSTHDHDLGLGNIAYMQLSRAARATAKAMLVQQVDRRAIVRHYLII
ncbi:hypothetical protein BGY98DRAFT_929289 [Russula aff. rugulosa BPL654]|nr:hypothetical protein BGY98DRAFT_929289 [Russula aff. rugulosa BPL654]